MTVKRAFALLLAVSVLGMAGGIGPGARAGDDANSGQDYYAGLTCGQLWYERNAIYASYGHCFKSERGIATFGRVCHPPYGKLPGNLQRVVAEIKAWERRRGCR